MEPMETGGGHGRAGGGAAPNLAGIAHGHRGTNADGGGSDAEHFPNCRLYLLDTTSRSAQRMTCDVDLLCARTHYSPTKYEASERGRTSATLVGNGDERNDAGAKPSFRRDTERLMRFARGFRQWRAVWKIVYGSDNRLAASDGRYDLPGKSRSIGKIARETTQ